MSASSYSLIRDLAQKRGVDPDLAEAVLHQESRGKPGAVSPKGAVGLMQTMPATLRDPGFGVKPAQNNTPEEAARVGVDYLKAMQKRYNGDIGKTLAAYNAGPGRADKYGADVPFKETRDYVRKITSHYQKLKKGQKSRAIPAPMDDGLDDGFGDLDALLSDTPSSGSKDSRTAKALPARTNSLAEMAINAAVPAAQADTVDDMYATGDFQDANGENADLFGDPLNTDGGDSEAFKNTDMAEGDEDPFAMLDSLGFDDEPQTGANELDQLDQVESPQSPASPASPAAAESITPPEGEFSPSLMSKLPSDVEGAAKALGFDPSKFPEKGSMAEKMLTPYEMATGDTYKGAMGRLAYGAEKTVDNFGNLLAMGADKLVGLDPKTKYYMDFLQKYRDATYAQGRHEEGAAPGEFDGMALAGSMAVPVPVGKAQGASTLAKIGKGMLTGGVAGAMYGDADIGSEDYWTQKALGTAVGAGAGGGLTGVLQGGKYAVNKGVNAVTGKMGDDAAELQKLADESGVRLLATDAMKDSKVTNTAAAVMNALPVVGTKGIRKQQTQQLATRAEQLAEEARAAAVATPFEKLKGAAKAVKDPKSREGVSAAIQKEAGGDLGKIVGASADLMSVKEARQADKLFTKVRDIADASNVTTDYANMGKALETQIDALKKSKFQDNTLFDALKFASDKIKRNPSMGMQDLLETRTTVKTLLDKANDSALFTHSPQAIRALSAVKQGLEADMLKAVGGPKSKLGKALAQADEFERVVVKGREGAKLTTALSAAKETGDYDEVANLVMRPHLVDRAAKSASLLDAKGKQALLASIMQKGVEQAKSSGTGEFSPKTMAVFLNRNAKALSTLGGPDYSRQVEGYKRLLQHMNVKTHEDKMTLGSTAIAAAAGSGLYSAAALSSPSFWASTAGMGLLFRTEAGKRVLLASSKTPIKSERMNALIVQMGQQATKAGALTATQQGLK